MSKKITIEVISARGHDVLEMDAPEALTHIKTNPNNKWVYVNGVAVEDLSALTINDIENAESIQMANELVGG